MAISSTFPFMLYLDQGEADRFFGEVVAALAENKPLDEQLNDLDVTVRRWKEIAERNKAEADRNVEVPPPVGINGRHTFVFSHQRKETGFDYYVSICKCGMPMDHSIHPGEHWFTFAYQKYDAETKRWTDYCRRCHEPRTSPNHFGEPDRDPKQPYQHTHAAGDIVKDRSGNGRRYEILTVGNGSYFVKKLFFEGDVEEFSWSHEGLEQACELEWSKGPVPLAEELAHTRDSLRQWRSAYFALFGALDHNKEGDALAMIERIRIQIQQWRRGELDTTSTVAGIYGEIVEGHMLPIIDENLKALPGSSG